MADRFGLVYVMARWELLAAEGSVALAGLGERLARPAPAHAGAGPLRTDPLSRQGRNPQPTSRARTGA